MRNSKRRKRVIFGAGVTAGATVVAPGVAQADTFEVTNLLDDGSAGTLRTAVDDAEANEGFDRILFASGLTGTITLTQGDLEISDSVEIVGPGHARVTVDGDDSDRIFSIYGDGPPSGLTNVTISGLTLTRGFSGDEGGAISSYGADLIVEDSVITGSFSAGEGGAIATKYGALILDSSVISGNVADAGGAIATKYLNRVTVNDTTISQNLALEEGGGGIFTVLADTMVVTNSTISGNQAPDGAGGGIASYAGNTLVANSTISGNSADDGAGVLAVNYEPENFGAKFTARNATIANNTAADYGGGMITVGDTAGFSTNSIIAGNTAAVAPNVGGDLDAAFTLIDNPAGGTITETTPGSNRIAEPQIGPLASNGGPTQTHALLAGSPAIDGGNGTGSNHDQRGQARPVDIATYANSTAPGADGSDIGAYESQAAPEGASCRGQAATIVAVPGVPTEGTEGGDVIIGTEGADQINGRGGGDLICGWGGDDTISGGDANDTILGHQGADSLSGDGGRDARSHGRRHGRGAAARRAAARSDPAARDADGVPEPQRHRAARVLFHRSVDWRSGGEAPRHRVDERRLLPRRAGTRSAHKAGERDRRHRRR